MISTATPDATGGGGGGFLAAGMTVLAIGIVLAAAGFYALRLSKTKQIETGNI